MGVAPKVVVVIVTWNSEDDIEGCLHSLQNLSYENLEVVVVDNHSTDETVAVIRKNFPQVTLLAQEKNLYFSGGNNLGIKYAHEELNPKFIALLNPDTYVSENWLSTQVAVMETEKSVGIVGPKVVFAEGFGTDEAKSAGKRYIINSVGLEKGGFLFPYDRGFGEVDQDQYQQTEVFGVSGVSMLLRVSMIERIGLLYEPMQMYLEDADLCTRARNAGWSSVFNPQAVVRHKHMQSTAKQRSNFYLLKSRRNYLLLVWRNYGLKKLLRGIYEVSKEVSLWQLLVILQEFMFIAIFKLANSELAPRQ